jgi:HNH endonuclease
MTGRLVVDHRTPHDRYPGSFYDLSNLWLLCSRDNNSKRDLSVEQWLAALARRRPSSVVSTSYTRNPAPGRYIFGGPRR